MVIKTKDALNFGKALLLFLVIISFKDSAESLVLLGIYNILLVCAAIYKFRDTKNISLILGIVLLVNLSYSLCVCINAHENAMNWQTPLVEKTHNIINIKSFTIFSTFFLFSLSPNNLKNEKFLSKNYSIVVVLICFVVLIYALLFGIDRGTTYVSNSKTIYEYAIVFFLIAWLYSGDSKVIKCLLVVYSCAYILQGLMFGDRSSAFPMILVELMLFTKNNLRMKHVLMIGIVGIVFGNFIDIARNDGLNSNFISRIISTGLNVNTISYSSYAGTQIIRWEDNNSGKLQHFINYTTSIVLGKTGKYNLASLANNDGYTNKGGGMSSTYFYYWGGYPGVILGGWLVGKIISKIFSKNNNISIMLQILGTAFSLRWYVYFPIVLFRTSIFVPLFIYLFFYALANIIRGKKKIFKGVFD